MRVIVEQSVECRLAGKTDVLGENLPQGHFLHNIYHMTWPVANPGRRFTEEHLLCLLVSCQCSDHTYKLAGNDFHSTEYSLKSL
jgi:hypothetical protein